MTGLILVAISPLLSMSVRWMHDLPDGSGPFSPIMLPVAAASVLALVATCRRRGRSRDPRAERILAVAAPRRVAPCCFTVNDAGSVHRRQVRLLSLPLPIYRLSAIAMAAFSFAACSSTALAAEPLPNGFSCDIDVSSEVSRIVDHYREDMGNTAALPVDVEGVKALLRVMRRGDQDPRFLAIGLMGCGTKPDSEVVRTVMSAGSTIGDANSEVLKRIIREKGWPVISTYGEESDQTAFLIAQHANRDRDFQRGVLEILAEKLPLKETSGENYALLFDRVQIGEGKLQRYGSQGRCDGRAWVPESLERPGDVDRLRDSVGLESLSDYSRKLSSLYCATGG